MHRIHINENECLELGCKDDFEDLKKRYKKLESFSLEGESFSQMVGNLLSSLNGRQIGAFLAICYLQPDTSLIEVSQAVSRLGEEGIFIPVESESKALKCIIGFADMAKF